ncbi:MAG: RNA polymerase subunit sigma [Xanthomonadales bacterium]|nr:RNA polymerase subunit sigma [Xanthomonadales bacterium]MCW5579452.1 sigma-70 family RNA polymerase sigma factor [Dokdonella sp.]MDL1867830.1 sigma-70 family RNA polymerase sigma factor [Gammaproteobacteria bacterium PRO6]
MTRSTCDAGLDPGLDSADLDAARWLAPQLLAALRTHAHFARLRVRAGETLCTTALVHEAWLRLQRNPRWNDERHFLRVAALAMRQALVDHARAQQTAKRGHGGHDTPAQAAHEPFWVSDEQLVALDEALQRLAALSPRLARVVECRFFAGYSDAETATVLGVTTRTVRRDWIKARAWLYRELDGAAAAVAGADHA